MTVEFRAKASNGEIWLYDQIGQSMWGDGISAKAFQKELSAMGRVTNISVRINSPGGDVFDGFAIYSQLQQHPANISVSVDGVAASIASIIAMAAGKGRLAMAKNALMMVHDPSGVAIGGESEMMRVASLLRTIKGNLADTYVSRTGNKRTAVDAWMADETWFTAESAIQNGFADVMTAESTVTACFDPSPFRNVPDWLKRQMKDSANEKRPAMELWRERIAEQRKRVAAVCRA